MERGIRGNRRRRERRLDIAGIFCFLGVFKGDLRLLCIITVEEVRLHTTRDLVRWGIYFLWDKLGGIHTTGSLRNAFHSCFYKKKFVSSDLQMFKVLF